MNDVLVLLKGLTLNFLVFFFLVFLYNQAANSVNSKLNQKKKILIGIILGCIACLGMLMGIELMPGMKVDGRMIIVSIAGAYAGPLVGAITTIIVLIFRVFLSGNGLLVGLTGIMGSYLVGVLFFFFLRSSSINSYSYSKLALLGLITTLQAQLWIYLFFPFDLAFQIQKKVFLIGILFYPSSTALLGFLIHYNQKQNELKMELEKKVIERTQKLNKEITEKVKVEEMLNEHLKNLESTVQNRTNELRKVQKKMITKEKLAAIGQLAGSVAHDIRNPLGVINNSIYFLKTISAGSADKRVVKHLEIMENEIGTTNNIINELLDFSKTNEPCKSTCDINKLISNLIIKMKIEPAISLQTNYQAGLPLIKVDPLQIERVIINLLTNAIDAIKGDGSIFLSTKQEGHVILITIKDSGMGIHPEQVQHIFDPLYTTKSKGAGLGLSIVKTFIDKHDGTITIDSKQDHGTSFKVNIPI